MLRCQLYKKEKTLPVKYKKKRIGKISSKYKQDCPRGDNCIYYPNVVLNNHSA